MAELQRLVVGDYVLEHNIPNITRRTKKLIEYVSSYETVRTIKIGRILRYPLALQHAGGLYRLQVSDQTDWRCIQAMMYISMQPEEYQTTKDLLRGLSFEMFINMNNDSSDSDMIPQHTYSDSEEVDYFDVWFGPEAMAEIEQETVNEVAAEHELTEEEPGENGGSVNLEITKSGDEL